HVQCLSRGKNVPSDVWRRVWRDRYLQVAIADHVEEDSTSKGFRRFALRELAGEMAGAVDSVRIAKGFKRLFTIEKDQLDLFRQSWIQGEHPRHFQKQPRARPSIVGPNKSKVVENLRVVMRTEKKARFRGVPEIRDQIDESDLSVWRLVG